MVRGSEAREARPPAATGEAVREGKHAETAALKGVTKTTTTTYDNILRAERSNGVLRAGGTGVTGGECAGCACLRA